MFFSSSDMQIAAIVTQHNLHYTLLATVMRLLKLSTVMHYTTALQTNVIWLQFRQLLCYALPPTLLTSSNRSVARELGVDERRICKWRSQLPRFNELFLMWRLIEGGIYYTMLIFGAAFMRGRQWRR